MNLFCWKKKNFLQTFYSFNTFRAEGLKIIFENFSIWFAICFIFSIHSVCLKNYNIDVGFIIF